MSRMEKVFAMPVASVYPHYVTKIERKGRTVAELDQVICWLTGLSPSQLHTHLEEDTTFAEFFDAVTLHPNATQITGTVCGMRVEEIEDPLTQKIRYLDKVVDELAKGKPVATIMRATV